MSAIAIACDIFGNIFAGGAGRIMVLQNAMLGTLALAAIIQMGVAMRIKSYDMLYHVGFTALIISLVAAYAQYNQSIAEGIMNLGIFTGGQITGGRINWIDTPDKIYYSAIAHVETIEAIRNEICGALSYKCVGSWVPTVWLTVAEWVILAVYIIASAMWVYFFVIIHLVTLIAMITMTFAAFTGTRRTGTAPLFFAITSFVQFVCLSVMLTAGDLIITAVAKATPITIFWSGIGLIVAGLLMATLLVATHVIGAALRGGGMGSVSQVSGPVMTSIALARMGIGHISNALDIGRVMAESVPLPHRKSPGLNITMNPPRPASPGLLPGIGALPVQGPQKALPSRKEW